MKKKSLLLGIAILALSTVIFSNLGYAQINTFPHIEDFEAGDGGWVASGTNSSWAHGAPSGTVIDGTVGSGSNAWVTNLSGNYNNGEESQLESPAYDFTALTSDPILSFDHIYETESCCDEGWVEYSIDGGTSWTKLGTSVSGINNWYNDAVNNWWDGVSGANGVWRPATHVLTGLAGQNNVKLRFKLSTDGSFTKQGFGVDNIIVHEAISDISIAGLVHPIRTYEAYSATEAIEVSYSNIGSLALATVDLCYTIDGGVPVCETFYPALDPGASTTATFAVPADLSALGEHVISVYYSNANEYYLHNDTTTITLTSISKVNTFPYFEDFEAGNGYYYATGTNSTWENGVPNSSFIDGTVGCGNSAWVTNLTGSYNNNENSQLVSVPFDFSGLATDPILRFDHIYDTESGFDKGWVEYSTDGGTTWTKLGTSASGISNWYNNADNDWWDGVSGASGAWRTASHELTGLAGESNVKLRFQISTDGSINSGGFGVDNIIIHDGIGDISIDGFVQPMGTYEEFGATETIEVSYSNLGLVELATVDLCYAIDGGIPVCETFSPALAPGASTTATFSVPADLSALGKHVISVYNSNASEYYLCNDTTTISLTSYLTVNTFPYLEDFEANNGGWITSGINSSWAHGVPNSSFIDGTIGCGNSAWVTNLTGSYNSNENSQLVSPPFDFSGLTTDPILRFDHIYDTESGWDKGWVEYSTDDGTTWTKLGTSASGISNWYNDADDNWWDGTSGVWRTASHELTGLAGQSNVKLRFQISTDNSVNLGGFGVDNIIVHEAISDISIAGLVQPMGTYEAFLATEAIEVSYSNLGSIEATTVDLCYSIDGGIPVCETFYPALAPGASTTATFAVPADLSALGDHVISVYYSNASEYYLCNDTTTIRLTTIPKVNTFPYFEDFEAGNGYYYATGANSTWENGVPNSSFIEGTVGCGNSAWVTNLTGSYNNNENSQLISVPFDFSGLATDPILRFDHIYDTESGFDKGWVEYSIDGGTTWTKLGTSASGISNWYNNANNDWWDGVSGASGVWQTSSHELTGLAGESNVRIRFQVSTDGSETRNGFGVDNIMIYEAMEIVDATPRAVSLADGCSLSATETISIDVLNSGVDNLTTIDVCYSVDGDAVICETVAVEIAPNSTETVNLVGTVDLSAAGTYTIEFVTGHTGDFQGCNDTLVVSVTNTVIALSATVVDETLGNDGSIDLTVTGGTTPYTFTWNNGAGSVEDPSSLAGNTTYLVTVMDDNGCTNSLSVFVSSLVGISEHESNFNVNAFPNPNNGEFVVELDEALEGTVEVFNITGKLVIAKEINNQSRIAFDLNNIEAGIYILNVMTSKGKATLRLVIQ